MRRVALAALALATFALLLVACGDDGGAPGQTPTSRAPTPTPLGAATPIDFGEPPMGTFAQRCQKSGEKQFAGPEHVIDTAKSYAATIKTAKGDIVVELFSDTPITTNNFVFLACKGFYDGLLFHRVVPDFVIQGGDPTGTGSGGPGYAIPDEDDGERIMDTGALSMAKAGPNTTGSQFFIVTGPRESVAHLDRDFTVFGQVTQGLDVAKAIQQGDAIETVTIEER